MCSGCYRCRSNPFGSPRYATEPADIEAKSAIIFFDGTCNLCSGALRARAGVVW
jgi:hypothetical protein